MGLCGNFTSHGADFTFKKKIGEAFKHNFCPMGKGIWMCKLSNGLITGREGLPLGVRDVEVFDACYTSSA